MLPSISTPHQELTPSQATAFVYLLVSRQYPGAYKLGVTKHPAMRFDALTKHFGPFDLESATKTYDQLASWSIATIQGRNPGKEMSLVPYATNQNACSRWAVMDFDAHHGEVWRAYGFARDSHRYFKKQGPDGVVAFLEHTGAGGWHLWLISLELHPCSWWASLLKEAAVAIGAPIQSGICELFPYE